MIARKNGHRRRSALIGAALLLAVVGAGRAAAEEARGDAPAETGATAAAPPAADAGPGAWNGEAEAGFISATGNSNSQSLRGRLKLGYSRSLWSHKLFGDLVRVQEQGTTTTEQYTAEEQSRREVSGPWYYFLGARYEADRMAGYSPRVAETTGFGRRWDPGLRLRLSAEAGAGGRQTWFTDGTRENEAIARLAGTLAWKIGAASELSEDAFSEFGERNVHSESSTSLKTRINGDFSLKANVTVKHDTVVPPGRYKTDTISSLTLVYDL